MTSKFFQSIHNFFDEAAWPPHFMLIIFYKRGYHGQQSDYEEN